MHTYTESTSISLGQLPIKSVKEWTNGMLRNGQAQKLFQMIDLIPQLYQLREEGLLYQFIDMDEQEIAGLAKEYKQSAEEIKQIKELKDRQHLLLALSYSERQYNHVINDLMRPIRPELDLNIGLNHLYKYTQEYFGKFLAYLEKTNANRSHIISFRSLRSLSTAAIAKFSQYTNSVDFTDIKEIIKKPKSVSKQKKLSEKKRRNEEPTENIYLMILKQKASEIRWRTKSAHKKK